MGFNFYTTQEYFTDLTRRISEAAPGDRVMLATMVFYPEDPAVGRLMDALRAAARRGVQVSLIVDAYSFLVQGGRRLGPLFFHRTLPENFSAAFGPVHAALIGLQSSGGRYAVINVPGRRYSNPIGGRSHIKFAIINDRIYVGGCNLDKSTHLDMMTAWDDARTARWLGELAEAMLATGSARLALEGKDISQGVSESASLLVDAGVAGRSLIYEKALGLIDAAREHITITCQYFPDFVTTRRLRAAHSRGVKVEIYYNKPSKHVWPYSVLHYGVEQTSRRELPKSFFVHVVRENLPYLHAKLIATEQGAIIGSHNYVSAGITLGTAEIALLNTDPEFARQAEKTMIERVIS